jgi:hypothetical protein
VAPPSKSSTPIATPPIRKLTTDAAGAYVAPLLPLGRYKLTVTASGFQQYNATDIVLNVSDRRVVDITPSVGANTQTINVTEAAEAITSRPQPRPV